MARPNRTVGRRFTDYDVKQMMKELNREARRSRLPGALGGIAAGMTGVGMGQDIAGLAGDLSSGSPSVDGPMSRDWSGAMGEDFGGGMPTRDENEAFIKDYLARGRPTPAKKPQIDRHPLAPTLTDPSMGPPPGGVITPGDPAYSGKARVNLQDVSYKREAKGDRPHSKKGGRTHSKKGDRIGGALAQFLRDTTGPTDNYETRLSPDKERAFRSWVKKNDIPFNPDQKRPQDYDMRGFWSGLMSGDPHATSGVDPNDGKLHFTDYYKTPYHETFSSESKFATPDAPSWQGNQLVSKDGGVVYDDTAHMTNFADRPSAIGRNTGALRGTPTIATSPADIVKAEIANGMGMPADNRMPPDASSFPTFSGVKEGRVTRAAPKEGRLGIPADELADLQRKDAEFRSLPPDRPMPNGMPTGAMKTSFGTIGAKPAEDTYQPNRPTDVLGAALAGLKGKFTGSGLTGTAAPSLPEPSAAGALGALKGLLDEGAAASTGPVGPDGVADPFGNYKPGGAAATAKTGVQETGGAFTSVDRQPQDRLPSPAQIASVRPDGVPVAPNYTPPAMSPPKNVPDSPPVAPSGLPASLAANAAKGVGSYLAGNVPRETAQMMQKTPEVAVPDAGNYPPKPDDMSLADQARYSPRVQRDINGLSIGGLPGLAATEIGSAINKWAGPNYGADIEPNAVGRIADAMGAARGSLGRSLSNPGSSYLSLGPDKGGIYTSGKYGWKEVWGPDGSIRGHQYNGDEGGILGAISRAIRDAFGGRPDHFSNKVSDGYFSKTPGPY